MWLLICIRQPSKYFTCIHHFIFITTLQSNNRWGCPSIKQCTSLPGCSVTTFSSFRCRCLSMDFNTTGHIFILVHLTDLYFTGPLSLVICSLVFRLHSAPTCMMPTQWVQRVFQTVFQFQQLEKKSRFWFPIYCIKLST